MGAFETYHLGRLDLDIDLIELCRQAISLMIEYRDVHGYTDEAAATRMALAEVAEALEAARRCG